jgi:hypothetical protein
MGFRDVPWGSSKETVYKELRLAGLTLSERIEDSLAVVRVHGFNFGKEGKADLDFFFNEKNQFKSFWIRMPFRYSSNFKTEALADVKLLTVVMKGKYGEKPVFEAVDSTFAPPASENSYLKSFQDLKRVLSGAETISQTKPEIPVANYARWDFEKSVMATSLIVEEGGLVGVYGGKVLVPIAALGSKQHMSIYDRLLFEK